MVSSRARTGRGRRRDWLRGGPEETKESAGGLRGRPFPFLLRQLKATVNEEDAMTAQGDLRRVAYGAAAAVLSGGDHQVEGTGPCLKEPRP